jgi:hypothetical protein
MPAVQVKIQDLKTLLSYKVSIEGDNFIIKYTFPKTGEVIDLPLEKLYYRGNDDLLDFGDKNPRTWEEYTDIIEITPKKLDSNIKNLKNKKFLKNLYKNNNMKGRNKPITNRYIKKSPKPNSRTQRKKYR